MDPSELDEAAIRFARGDFAGAEQALRQALDRSSARGESAQDLWLTLFDLYRATGQSERFDVLALDFARTFSRSAPLWLAMPAPAPAPVLPAPGPRRCDAAWTAPSMLLPSSVRALCRSLDQTPSPWVLDWSRLTAIEPTAISLLTEGLGAMAQRPGLWVFEGSEALHALLLRQTPVGDPGASPAWWRLRLALLRLQGQAEAFEQVALDYCVTYEVSPASWCAPLATYTEALVAPPDRAPDPASPGMQPGAQTPPQTPHPVAALCGHIEGDAMPWLTPLESLLRPGEPLLIDCSQLVRMDFAAASTVLNWVAGLQAQGHAVVWGQLQRLVAAFFRVLGIHEYARIVLRSG